MGSLAPRPLLLPRALLAPLLRAAPAVPVGEHQPEREQVQQPPPGLEELQPLGKDRAGARERHHGRGVDSVAARAHRLFAPRLLRNSRSPASTVSSSSVSGAVHRTAWTSRLGMN